MRSGIDLCKVFVDAREMRWVLFIALLLVLVGCRVVSAPKEVALLFNSHPSVSLNDYLSRQRELNEKYLYGTPLEALKALEELAELEEDYAAHGQRPIDSNYTRMLAYSRLFALSERLKQRPEAEAYLEKAISFAVKWRPEVGALSQARQVDFVRNYVDNFEEGLEVRWKTELK